MVGYNSNVFCIKGEEYFMRLCRYCPNPVRRGKTICDNCLLKQIKESEKKIKAGKGKELKSLKQLR